MRLSRAGFLRGLAASATLPLALGPIVAASASTGHLAAESSFHPDTAADGAQPWTEAP